MTDPTVLCAIDGQDARLTDACTARMCEAVTRAVEAEGIGRAALNILVTYAKEVRALNSSFRGIDATTDVLSFPANDLHCPLQQAMEEGFVPEYEDGRIALGDIAIDIDRAGEQAREFGNSLAEELAFLSVHGTLHLLGYDHIDPEEEKIMRQKQRIALGRQESRE